MVGLGVSGAGPSGRSGLSLNVLQPVKVICTELGMTERPAMFSIRIIVYILDLHVHRQ
jgi:hypothetical protein